MTSVMLFVPFFCISTLQSTQFIRLLYSECDTMREEQVQVTTYIAATVIAETTVLADQNPLTTQFYLLLAESPL